MKKHHLCSEPANRRTSVIIPTAPLHCDGNGTLNQFLAPSGFITRWQAIVAALWWQQVAVEGGLEKVRQMVRRDDNGAISQRILHLWCDGGGCWGLLMPAEMNAMDEHISYWQPPYHCWLRCLDTHSRELWKQTLREELLNFGWDIEKVLESVPRNNKMNIGLALKVGNDFLNESW